MVLFCCDSDITHDISCFFLSRSSLCPPPSSRMRVARSFIRRDPDVQTWSRTGECCHVRGEGGVSTTLAQSLPPILASHWSADPDPDISLVDVSHLTPTANCGLIWGHWGNMMLRVMFPGLCQNIAIYRYETRPSINPLNWGHNNCMGHLLLRCRVPFLQLWFSSFCHGTGGRAIKLN